MGSGAQRRGEGPRRTQPRAQSSREGVLTLHLASTLSGQQESASTCSGHCFRRASINTRAASRGRRSGSFEFMKPARVPGCKPCSWAMDSTPWDFLLTGVRARSRVAEASTWPLIHKGQATGGRSHMTAGVGYNGELAVSYRAIWTHFPELGFG